MCKDGSAESRSGQTAIMSPQNWGTLQINKIVSVFKWENNSCK